VTEVKNRDDGENDREAEGSRLESDPPVPKLPRGPLLSKVAVYDLFRIALFASVLVAVLTLREPCSQAVGNFFNALDGPPSSPDADSPDATPLPRYERLTPEQIRQRFPGPDAGAETRQR
jgi:hypothetical protein